MHPAHRQASSRLRVDWGLPGARRVASGVDVAVVVDVLSATTTVGVAVQAGTAVLPLRWRDARAADAARDHRAVLAVPRAGAAPGQVTLSPASVRRALLAERLVLPSPNGCAVAAALAASGAVVLAASLREAAAVARWVDGHADRRRASVAVVAAGEVDEEGGLRPAAEDLWGAGAVVGALLAAGWDGASPEAELAAVAAGAVRGREREALLACASGRELVDGGYAEDVEVAAEVGSSGAVPLLVDGWFANAG